MDRTLEPADRGDERTPQAPQPREGRNPLAGDRNHKRPDRNKDVLSDGRRRYSTSAGQRQTMFEIGRFRTLGLRDLERIHESREAQWRADVRSLVAQGLVQTKIVWTGKDREKRTFLALTKAGKRLLQRQGDISPEQALYAGFVKPAELQHDAAIYPMFVKESARIEAEGGRVRRVVLDFELKRKAYPALAKARVLSPAEYAKKQAEIAREHGLKVVNSHLVLPDLRIEYETRDGLAAQLDLEVASEHYHGSHAAEKAAAGFRIYAAADIAARLSRVLEEREITADILSL